MFRPASTKYFGVFSSARLAIDDEASASRVLWNSGGNARAAVVEEKEAKPQRSSDFTERMLAAVPLDYADGMKEDGGEVGSRRKRMRRRCA